MTAVIVATEDEVRRSVESAREAGGRFFDEIVWQIERQAWTVLGYADWDAMRAGEYADMGVVVPRADRPELVTRLRRTGMTQQEVADTLGVDQRTAGRDLNRQMPNEEPTPITNSRGQERPASYAPRQSEPEVNADTGEVSDDYQPEPEPRKVTGLDGKTYTRPVPKAEPIAPSKPKRRAITDQARTAGWELRKAVERLERIADDDRFTANTDQVAPHLRSHLSNAIEVCQGLLDRINNNQ